MGRVERTVDRTLTTRSRRMREMETRERCGRRMGEAVRILTPCKKK